MLQSFLSYLQHKDILSNQKNILQNFYVRYHIYEQGQILLVLFSGSEMLFPLLFINSFTNVVLFM